MSLAFDSLATGHNSPSPNGPRTQVGQHKLVHQEGLQQIKAAT